MLSERPQVVNHIKNVLVDHYQDINDLEARIIRALGSHGGIVIIGDPGQSIYGFLNFGLDNFIKFRESYPTHTIIEMGQNYRSTSAITEISNAVLHQSEVNVIGTCLTLNTIGKEMVHYMAATEMDQVKFVAERILMDRVMFWIITDLWFWDVQMGCA